jgi:hypothetical protein
MFALSVRVAELWFKHVQIQDDGSQLVDADTLRAMVWRLARFMNLNQGMDQDGWYFLLGLLMYEYPLVPSLVIGFLRVFPAFDSLESLKDIRDAVFPNCASEISSAFLPKNGARWYFVMTPCFQPNQLISF